MESYIIVRKGQIDDLSELQHLFVDTVRAICVFDYTKQQIDAWVSSIENQQRWLEIISKQFVLVVQDQGKIVGFATLDDGNYLDLMYVHKDHQRQGIAQLLLDAIEAEARRLHEFVLTSDVSKTALPFFYKNGFTVVEELKNIRKEVEIINYKMIKQL